jgi:hypothetical protein
VQAGATGPHLGVAGQRVPVQDGLDPGQKGVRVISRREEGIVCSIEPRIDVEKKTTYGRDPR